MTPAEYRNGGKSLSINYSFAESPFGNLLVASTKKGICYMAFDDGEGNTLHNLKQKFPNATLHQKSDLIQQNALLFFRMTGANYPK
jgi:AraC family transcriptional regulator of adaptative response/methylated-DNA-[protein]-cysteine methyltransferase